ncbi:MAG: magnesium transporter CorA [Lachnospiraceae bacterium]|nr:magnesium transporter CorA [Lachnospiraceae bacterium]
MYYLIKERLTECDAAEVKKAIAGGVQYVAVLTQQEWTEYRESFEMGIDMELDTTEIHSTKLEVNFDSLTGSFAIPNRKDLSAEEGTFAFAMDEKGVVFIDDSGTAAALVEKIQKGKYWRFPGLERFLYDVLETIVHDDLKLLEAYERELDLVEKKILADEDGEYMERINMVRGDVRELRISYEQLMDLGQELEENENDFFKEENLRYFHLFLNRMARLTDVATALRDYTMQLSDLYKSRVDMKQNRIMTLLTVVTAIFMPLTLITGWYGMNFVYMPELSLPYAYPVVIGVCILIVVLCLVFFRKKKWL